MKLFNKKVESLFNDKKAIKIISGIDNINIKNILEYVRACEISQATYIDIVASPDLVYWLKKLTDLPICVSSINVQSLYDSVLAGADIIELGNFDNFYSHGIILSPQQILVIAQQIKNLLPYTDICVTIPHVFSLDQQIKLALRLENLGINLIQTEGHASKIISPHLIDDNIIEDYLSDSILQSSSSLSSVYFLSNTVKMPIIAASHMNTLTAPMAVAYGASGIGMKSALSQLSNITSMSLRISEIINSLNINPSAAAFKYKSSYSNLNKFIFYNI